MARPAGWRVLGWGRAERLVGLLLVTAGLAGGCSSSRNAFELKKSAKETRQAEQRQQQAEALLSEEAKQREEEAAPKQATEKAAAGPAAKKYPAVSTRKAEVKRRHAHAAKHAREVRPMVTFGALGAVSGASGGAGRGAIAGTGGGGKGVVEIAKQETEQERQAAGQQPASVEQAEQAAKLEAMRRAYEQALESQQRMMSQTNQSMMAQRSESRSAKADKAAEDALLGKAAAGGAGAAPAANAPGAPAAAPTDAVPPPPPPPPPSQPGTGAAQSNAAAAEAPEVSPLQAQRQWSQQSQQAAKDTTPLRETRNNSVKVRVFYATDRARASATAKGVAWGADENKANELRYGSVIVNIPPGHKPGQLESPSIFRLEFSEDPAKHVMVEKVTEEDKAEFFTDLHVAVQTTPRKEVLLFIHGYRVTFEEAARRTAQLSYDLGFGGAPVLYSWPSRGTFFGYNADEESALWTTLHLKGFLQDVYERSGATVVHVIAHSMGNRALLSALEMMASEKTKVRFGQIVLAAPDVARGLFLQQIPMAQPLAQHITLYASSGDQALAASEMINHYPRAGQSGGELTIIPPVETIDASAVTDGFLGHSYFGDNVLVLEDMVYLIRDSLPAARRTHLKAGYMQSNIYWTFFP